MPIGFVGLLSRMPRSPEEHMGLGWLRSISYTMTDTMSLAELIEEEKSLAAAVATATAVAKASKAAHKAAAERLTRYKIGYSSIWRSFATRLQIEKQKRQKLLVNLHDIDIQ